MERVGHKEARRLLYQLQVFLIREKLQPHSLVLGQVLVVGNPSHASSITSNRNGIFRSMPVVVFTWVLISEG